MRTATTEFFKIALHWTCHRLAVAGLLLAGASSAVSLAGPYFCGSVNPIVGYGNPYYGGSWGSVHRDSRNSDFADCELPSRYAGDWTVYSRGFHFVAWKPVIGPGDIAWIAVGPDEGFRNAIYLYGIDVASGQTLVRLTERQGLNVTVGFSIPLIDRAGNIYISQDKKRPKGTACRYQGEAETAGILCGELLAFTSTGNRLWKIDVDAASLSAQWMPDGELLMQTWRGTTYVIDTDATRMNPPRVVFTKNHFPEAAAKLPDEADGDCLLRGQGLNCLIANTPAVNPQNGAIYNIVQNFYKSPVDAELLDAFMQRWTYNPVTHAVELDLEWNTDAALLSGSATSLALHYDGSVLFTNDQAKGFYAIDALSGEVVASTKITYNPGGSPIIAPQLDDQGRLIGAYAGFNKRTSGTEDAKKIVEYSVMY